MVKPVELPLVTYCIRMLVCVPAVLFLIQLPATVPGKAEEDSLWALPSWWETRMELPVSASGWAQT